MDKGLAITGAPDRRVTPGGRLLCSVRPAAPGALPDAPQPRGIQAVPRPPNPELPRLLMDAALELLDERQDVQFSMRELSARVGYAVTAVYRCYETRGDLLRKLTVQLFGMLAADIVRPEPGASAVDVVGGLGERFIAWSVRYPGRFRLMFQYAEPDARLTPAEQEVARSGLRYLERVLDVAARRGEVRVEDPRAMATILFSSLVGLASLAVAGRLDGLEGERVVEYYRAHRESWIRPLLSVSPG